MAAATLAIVHLFVPTTIGSTDSGDGIRLLCQLQARDIHFGDGHNSRERFVTFFYHAVPKDPKHCGAWRTTGRYPSSALAVLGAAKVLTHLTFDDRQLDTRFAGILYSLLFGLAIGLLVVVLPGPRWARLLTAGAVGVLGADSVFVPYFISAYSEPMEYVMMLLSLVGLLALWRRGTVPVTLLALVSLAFALLITAKTQDTPLVAFLVIILLSTRCPIGRLRGRFTARLAPAVVSSILLALAAGMVYLNPINSHEQQVYSGVFYTILKDSPDPAADLAEMGLPTSLAQYAGKQYFQTRFQIAKDPDYKVFVAKISFRDIASFYVRHPERLEKVSAQGAREVVDGGKRFPNTTRANSTGDRPDILCRICIIRGVGPRLAPVGHILWPVWVATVLLVGALLTWRRRHIREWRALGLLLVTMMAFSFVGYSTAVLGDGYAELNKHVFPAVVTTWLSIPLVGLALAGLISRRLRQVRDADEPPTQPVSGAGEPAGLKR